MARFLFEKNLIQGFDIEEPDLLHARWRSADAFYERFHDWLLESEVPIHEVRSTTSVLERAIQSAPV